MKKRSIIRATVLVVALLVQSLCCAGFASAETTGLKGQALTDLPTGWDLTGLFADADAFEADMKRVEELLSTTQTCHSERSVPQVRAEKNLYEMAKNDRCLYGNRQ